MQSGSVSQSLFNEASDSSEVSDLREYLQAELNRRCKQNSRYSIRAFARSLGIGSSHLSKILTGKRTVSLATFTKLSQKLGLSPAQHQKLVPLGKRRGHSCKLKSYEASKDQFRPLSLDEFEVISEWYHFAILELIGTKDFESNPRWVAKRLGLTLTQVTIAAERMKRLGILSVDDFGRWHDQAEKLTTTNHPSSNAAFRKLQKQILQGAIEALEEVPFEKRDQSAITFAMNPKLVPEVKERIKKFRRELAAFIRSNSPYGEVYQMSFSLYPVSKNKKPKERSHV